MNFEKIIQSSLALLLIGSMASPTWAASVAEAEGSAEPEIIVTGKKDSTPTVSSSSVALSQEELFDSHVFTVNEVLRKVPGVYVRDEEGFGIRPNIGMRGMNPFRSTKVLFMEDGLLLNFAPYGDNDIYYHPPVERYEGIEVLKGAELNQYGPQTIGGAINYRTPAIPDKPGGFISFTGGNRDYLSGHVRYGGKANKVSTIDSVGGMVDYIHKEGNGSRDNTFVKLDDVNLKAELVLNPDNKLILRGDFYEEQSQSTFGLTEAEYKNFGRFYNPFKNDAYATNRWATSATHEYQFNDQVSLSTSFYWSEFNRDWWRQMNQQPTDGQCGAAFRTARLNGQAVDVDSCNFTRGRLRSYETWGVTPTLTARHNLFGVPGELKAGFRAHLESQYRKTEDGNSPVARDGKLIENQQRFAEAFSGFVQNSFTLGDWRVTPGVRVESVNYQRKNLLPGQLAAGNYSLIEPLPSFALDYLPNEQLSLFFNMHRGFAPPRVEDSVYNNGNSVEIGPEKSWNYEAGIRTQPVKGAKADLTLFHNDFEALTVLGTVGGNDTPVAQGKALFQGLEFSGRLDAGELFGWTHNPYVQIAYTWVPTADSVSAFQCLPLSNGSMSPNCPGGKVLGSESGKRLPYAPEHLVTATVGYSHPKGFDVHLETVFVDQQFGDFMNLPSGSDHPKGPDSNEAKSGQYGKIQDYAVVNFATTYRVYRGLDLYFSVKNIFDNRYISDRVRGILPGTPRLIQAGFKYEF